MYMYARIKGGNTNSNLIEIVAGLFHIRLTVVRHPATPEKPAFWLRILQRDSQKTRILLADLNIQRQCHHQYRNL